MSNTVITEQVELVINTGWCGHYIALPQSRWDKLRETGEAFWCPYGEQTVFGNSENERLRKELAKAQELANAARTREADALRKAESALSREQKAMKEAALLQKRVEAGVCPHCHRTFKQVQAHMARKHPETRTS